ncbi:MAG: hypothetical protein VZQ80_09025 [Lachnospiraceae bacterium]|nr:hypothetical protein [Lachnospiraceae bacterium]
MAETEAEKKSVSSDVISDTEEEKAVNVRKTATEKRQPEKRSGGRHFSLQTTSFLTLLAAYAGAFLLVSLGALPAGGGSGAFGIDWAGIPVFLLFLTAVLLPAVLGRDMDLFDIVSDRVFFWLLTLLLLLCVLKYYNRTGTLVSTPFMLVTAAVLLFLYALLRYCYRRAFAYAKINKYALRIIIFALTGLSAPYIAGFSAFGMSSSSTPSSAAGFSSLSLFLLLLPAALFILLFVPLFLAGRPARQETALAIAFKSLCRALPESPVPPAVFAFLPFLLADVLLD